MASVLSLSRSPSAHALVVGYIVPAHTVFTLRHTGIGVLGASASDLCRIFCNCNRWPQLFPVVPTVYSCTCGDIHCAGTSSVFTPRKNKYWSTSRLRLQPLLDRLRLQQGAQFFPCRAHRLHLHLWWSTSRRHQQFMLHLRLSWCTSRWHKQCLTPRNHKYWSTSRLHLQPLPDRLRLQQGAQFFPCRAHRLHLHLWWSTSRRHQQFMLHLRLSWCTSRWHKQCFFSVELLHCTSNDWISDLAQLPESLLT